MSRHTTGAVEYVKLKISIPAFSPNESLDDKCLGRLPFVHDSQHTLRGGIETDNGVAPSFGLDPLGDWRGGALRNLEFGQRPEHRLDGGARVYFRSPTSSRARGRGGITAARLHVAEGALCVDGYSLPSYPRSPPRAKIGGFRPATSSGPA